MHEKSITLLNKAVADELSAVHQYMYFHFHCGDQGLDVLAALFRQTAIQEMMHVERLSERILFFKGDVDMALAMPVEKTLDVAAMLQLASKMEQDSARSYNLWANECAANADSVTKKLFEDLVADEEGHYDQFDIEHEKLRQYGDSYLALQSMESSRAQISSGGA